MTLIDEKHFCSTIEGDSSVTEEIAEAMQTEGVLPNPVNAYVRPATQHDSRQKKVGLSILTADEIPEWDALVAASPQCSIFCRSWWLKAACSEVHVLGYFEDGHLLAGIPLNYQRRFGLKLCSMPKLTQTMGVVFAPLPGKSVTVEGRETAILNVFAEQLASERIFIQAFHPESRNWLPFYWCGFTQTTHYTYVLDDLSSLDCLWNGLDKDRRTNIRKARRSGIRIEECGAEEVFAAASASFERQGQRCPYSLEYLSRLVAAARSNDAGICLSATDGRGRLHSAVFFVWDSKRGYQLAGGHDPMLGSSGGTVLLVWNLIEFAAAHTSIFDFEGSMRKQIEASFRSFGAKRIPYHRIVKMPPWIRACLCATGKVSI
jgi:hypothetical protein